MDRRAIFHTHTYLCGHASGHVWDYCEEAVRNGVETLGFTDHTPYPGDGLWKSVRMGHRDLKTYVGEVEESRRLYAGKLRILLGIEAEYVPEMLGYFKDELLGELKMDYLMMAPHSFLKDGEWIYSFGPAEMGDDGLRAYTDYVITAMETGLYAFVAHPDVFGASYRGWTDEATACSRAICQAAQALGMPLELNTYGIRKGFINDRGTMRYGYPLERFWEVAGEEGVEALVNTDAHRPCDVWSNYQAGIELASKHGVKVINEEFSKRFEPVQ